MFRLITLTIATDGDGAATVTSTEHVNGLLYGLRYVPGTIDTGADLTISFTNSVITQTVLTITNAGTSAISWYPRVDTCGATGTALSANDQMVPIIGYLKVVVAQGAATKAGALYGIILVD